jgi:hypothetical protein
VHFATLVEYPDRIVVFQAARAASAGFMSSATAGLGSSPIIELIVRSLAGEINASGKRSLAGSGWNV